MQNPLKPVYSETCIDTTGDDVLTQGSGFCSSQDIRLESISDNKTGQNAGLSDIDRIQPFLNDTLMDEVNEDQQANIPAVTTTGTPPGNGSISTGSGSEAINSSWSDPPLNTSEENPYFYNNSGWVINESDHTWVLDINPSNNTGTGSVQYDPGYNMFTGFGQEFAILINASNVIFDGMGAVLNGNNETDYGIIVNNQSLTSYNVYSSDPVNRLGGISITNITVTGFKIAGIFYNNVLGSFSGPGTIPADITDVNASNNAGTGISLRNSGEIVVTRNQVSGNGQDGIFLNSSDTNTLSENTLRCNKMVGINRTRILRQHDRLE